MDLVSQRFELTKPLALLARFVFSNVDSSKGYSTIGRNSTELSSVAVVPVQPFFVSESEKIENNMKSNLRRRSCIYYVLFCFIAEALG
jgi:hypothetical protein